MNATKFRDRTEARRGLAAELSQYRNRDDVLVFALPRGGVPVAYEVARALRAPRDAFLARKRGLPGHEEYAMGAIAEGGAMVLSDDVIEQLHIPQHAVEATVQNERAELERRARLYRNGPPPPVRGRTVILVDDGLATGSSMRAAVNALRSLGPARIVVAVPVAARETCEALREEAHE